MKWRRSQDKNQLFIHHIYSAEKIRGGGKSLPMTPLLAQIFVSLHDFFSWYVSGSPFKNVNIPDMTWWCSPGVNDSLGFSSCKRLLKPDCKCNGRYDDVLRNVTWHDAVPGVNVAPDPGSERPGPVRGWAQAEPGICRHSPPSSSSSSLVFSRCQSHLTPITQGEEKKVIRRLMILKGNCRDRH